MVNGADNNRDIEQRESRNKDRNAKALKSGFWYIVSNVLVRGMTVITTPIFSRLMTHEQVGEYSNFHSWLTIAVIVVTMRMESSLISAKFDFKENLGKYNRSVITLTAIVTAIWALVLNAFPDFFGEKLGFGQFYINLLLVYCLFHAIINIYQINERYHFRYKRSVFISITVAISTALLSIILVILMTDRVTGRVLGGIVPIAVIGIILFLYFFRKERCIDIKTWPYILKICIPYIPHLLSLQVLNSVDRIMITRICGAADNALYTVAYTCGHMVTLLMAAMNSAFSPWLGEKLHEGSTKEIRRVTKYYISLFSIMALGMMLLAPEVLFVMGGRSYLDARFVMPPVAMGCVCQFLYTLYVNVEQYKKKTVGMAFVSVGAAVLNYILNAYFIPIYGYNAAAYTTLAGYLFLLFTHMLLVKKLNLGDIYDNKFVLLLVVLMLGITIGINFLYSNSMLRYAAIIIMAISAAVLIKLKWAFIRPLLKRIVK